MLSGCTVTLTSVGECIAACGGGPATSATSSSQTATGTTQPTGGSTTAPAGGRKCSLKVLQNYNVRAAACSNGNVLATVPAGTVFNNVEPYMSPCGEGRWTRVVSGSGQEGFINTATNAQSLQLSCA